MPKTHIIVIPDEKFDDFRNGLTLSVVLKPERTISQDDTIWFENAAGDQYSIVVGEVSTPPGLLKGWVLLEATWPLNNNQTPGIDG